MTPRPSATGLVLATELRGEYNLTTSIRMLMVINLNIIVFVTALYFCVDFPQSPRLMIITYLIIRYVRTKTFLIKFDFNHVKLKTI